MNGAINDVGMVARLDGVKVGSMIFASYLAAGIPSEKADREATGQGARRHFVGTLHSVKRNKAGETYMTLWCLNRGDGGAYRSLNPSKGKLLLLEVI